MRTLIIAAMLAVATPAFALAQSDQKSTGDQIDEVL